MSNRCSGARRCARGIVTVATSTRRPTMTVCTDSAAPAEATAVSIYQAIGGRAAVTAAVDGLYGRLIADPVVGRFFPGGVAAKHRAYVVTVLGEALGGPER